MNIENIKGDLAVFSDLGTNPPEIYSEKDRKIVRMCRGGQEPELEIEFYDAGIKRIIERIPYENEQRIHKSYRALLASERFGDLRKWAESQRVLLSNLVEDSRNNLKMRGKLSERNDLLDTEELDIFLVNEGVGRDNVKVLLIDGPAGIGKTRFIENLACQRAYNYLNTQRPLILHVESRGRVLTFIQDLIAFSLQRMRLSVTFDQVPILVRNGLISIAIDGFDELGDPSGYEHAWGQLNDLIGNVRGGGTIILAGRDTFIGSERIRRDIKSLRETDTVDAFSLQPPTPQEARTWLINHEWTDDDVKSVNELFEVGSYALRPFFLVQLADREIASSIRDTTAGTPLAFLVELMVNREVGKFGDSIDVMDKDQLYLFVRRFLRETARFMAEDQAEAIDIAVLTWIVEISAPEHIGADFLNLLKNRAGVFAFLSNDSARNHRRFAHSQLFNHFLSDETIDTIGQMEVPKFIRRNILAADFLAAFGDLVLHAIHRNETHRISKFVNSAVKLVQDYQSFDRTPRNLGALLISMLPALEYLDDVPSLGPLHMDEAVIKEGTITATLDRVIINQLDIRGSDIRKLSFINCSIVTLIVNESTRLSLSLPTPSIVRIEEKNGQRTIVAHEKVREWMLEQKPKEPAQDMAANRLLELAEHPLVRLLERACRNRSYWIKQSEDDKISARLVRDPYWEQLVKLLQKHDLVRIEQKPSGGQPAQFLHIKRPLDILVNESDDSQIRDFYRSLEATIRM